MGRRPSYVPLRVYLNNRRVGTLSRETSGAISFAYYQNWLDWSNALPVSLSLPLRETPYRGEPVVAVFENLLPDSDALRRRVAEKVGARGIDAYSLLSIIGRDCVGALQFLPPEDVPGAAGEVNGTAMNEAEIAGLIRQLRINPLGLDPDDGDFRISIAGAQDKTALLKKGGVWHRPISTTATTHILKPAIGVIQNGIDLTDSVQNEYACLRHRKVFFPVAGNHNSSIVPHNAYPSLPHNTAIPGNSLPDIRSRLAPPPVET